MNIFSLERVAHIVSSICAVLHHLWVSADARILHTTFQFALYFTRNLTFLFFSEVHLSIGDKIFENEEFFQISMYPTLRKLVLVMLVP